MKISFYLLYLIDGFGLEQSYHVIFGGSKKNKAFEVFNDYDVCIYTAPLPKTNFCQWTTQEDGIYLTNRDGIGYRYTEWWGIEVCDIVILLLKLYLIKIIILLCWIDDF